MGLPAEFLGGLMAAEQDSDRRFEVWPVNMAIIDAFLAVATQWRTLAMPDGRVLWTGLDYTAVRAGLRGAGIRLTPLQWLRLGTVEREASDKLNGVRG